MIPNDMLLTILSSILFIHVYTGFAFEKDVFVINRNTGPSGDVRNGKDSFEISPLLCDRALPTTGDECESFHADPPTSVCSCPCPEGRATFVFQNNRWVCLENGRIRLLQDCNHTTYFLNEGNNPRSRLWTLNIPDTKLIAILSGGQYGWQRCEMQLNSSWYLGCNGTRVRSSLYLRKMKELFAFEASASSGYFALKVNGNVQNAHLVQGKIINLAIRCTRPNRLQYHSCLMFKLSGQQTCPEPAPNLQTFSTMIPQDTTNRTGTPTKINMAAFPSTVVSRPSLGREKGTKGNSRSLGLIAAITFSIVLIIVIIIVLLVHRHRSSSKTEPHGSTASIKDNHQDKITINPQIHSAFQQDDENGNKRPSNRTRERQISGLSYSVPRRQVGKEDGFKSIRIPAPMNTPHQRNISWSGNGQELESIYNVIEQQVPDSKTGIQPGSIAQNAQELDPAYNVFKQPGFMKGAIRLEQPVYNILQVLSTADRSERPVKYGREPECRVLEGPYPNPKEEEEASCHYGTNSSVEQSTSDGKEEPVHQGAAPEYFVLEGPYPKEEEGSRHYRTNSSGGQFTSEEQEEPARHSTAPVYNVLEGPYPKKESALAMLMTHSQRVKVVK